MKGFVLHIGPTMPKAHWIWAGVMVLAPVLAATPSAISQAITIDTHGNATQPSAMVDRRYAQIVPTSV